MDVFMVNICIIFLMADLGGKCEGGCFSGCDGNSVFTDPSSETEVDW